MGTDDGNSGGPKDNAFRTQRLQTLSGLNPAFAPGEFVYLVATLPGFPAGTRFKVASAQATGPGQYRYELSSGDKTVWVGQADVRGSAPDPVSDSLAGEPGRAFSMTQRMQTLTLSQRMAALGISDSGLGATQRMRAFNANDLQQREGAKAPDPEGPVTGMPPYKDEDDTKKDDAKK
jgi:hypothetical protein